MMHQLRLSVVCLEAGTYQGLSDDVPQPSPPLFLHHTKPTLLPWLLSSPGMLLCRSVNRNCWPAMPGSASSGLPFASTCKPRRNHQKYSA